MLLLPELDHHREHMPGFHKSHILAAEMDGRWQTHTKGRDRRTTSPWKYVLKMMDFAVSLLL